MNRVRKWWGLVPFLCLLGALLLLAGCAGGMEEESAEAPVPEATWAPEGEPLADVESAEEAGEPAPLPRTPAPLATVLPTPDFGSIAYDVPDNMVRGEAVQVILLVSPSEDAALLAALEEELESVGQDPDNPQTATIKVAAYMAAQLDGAPGDAFDIVPLQADNAQPLNEDGPTQWEWTVVPLKGGRHRLILRIDRLVERGDILEPLKEEVHRDDVVVDVPVGLRLQDAAGGFDLKWLAGVFIFPLFFYILSRRDKSGE